MVMKTNGDDSKCNFAFKKNKYKNVMTVLFPRSAIYLN